MRRYEETKPIRTEIKATNISGETSQLIAVAIAVVTEPTSQPKFSGRSVIITEAILWLLKR